MNTDTIRPTLSEADSLADLQGKPRTLSYRLRRALLVPVLALVAVLTGNASAEESQHPAVQAAGNANVAFVACVQAMTQAATTMQSETARAMMIEGAPEKCARNVRAPAVQAGPTTSDRVIDFGKFLVGAVAQYKGQALIWGAVTSLVNRGYDATENTASQGLQTAENLGTLGMDYASKPPLVIHAAPPPQIPAAGDLPAAPTE